MPSFLSALSSHILVVENEADLHVAIRIALEHEGHQVTITTSKAAALALLSAVRIDLVIADIGLPDGLGTDVLTHAAAVGVPGIAMTGHPKHMAEFDIKGVTYLAKPFRLGRLQEEIRNKLQPAGASKGVW
jgi:DNA-binding response OmpR family regulator